MIQYILLGFALSSSLLTYIFWKNIVERIERTRNELFQTIVEKIITKSLQELKDKSWKKDTDKSGYLMSHDEFVRSKIAVSQISEGLSLIKEDADETQDLLRRKSKKLVEELETIDNYLEKSTQDSLRLTLKKLVEGLNSLDSSISTRTRARIRCLRRTVEMQGIPLYNAGLNAYQYSPGYGFYPNPYCKNYTARNWYDLPSWGYRPPVQPWYGPTYSSMSNYLPYYYGNWNHPLVQQYRYLSLMSMMPPMVPYNYNYYYYPSTPYTWPVSPATWNSPPVIPPTPTPTPPQSMIFSWPQTSTSVNDIQTCHPTTDFPNTVLKEFTSKAKYSDTEYIIRVEKYSSCVPSKEPSRSLSTNLVREEEQQWPSSYKLPSILLPVESSDDAVLHTQSQFLHQDSHVFDEAQAQAV